MRGIFILCFFLLFFEGYTNTIHVGKLRIYKTIIEGIHVSKIGDTVLVDPGYYKEKNLVVHKQIVLSGINYPILDGEKKYEIISVKSDGVVIEGFKLVHSGISSLEDLSAIKLYDCKKVIIQNNILADNFFGIYAENSRNCTIANNHITAFSMEEQQSGNGIHCWKSDSIKVMGNTISGHRDGIYFEFVTHSEIKHNVSYNNIRYGLHFMFSNNDVYFNNHFKNNGAGVSVMYSHGVKMIKNLFEENWGDAAYGLLLKEITDSYIEGNTFMKNTTGIYMEGASRITIQKNSFSNNGWGLKIQASCMDITLTKNNFIGNTFDVSTNGFLVLNTFNGNYWDKYEGYDLNKDNWGDVPYRPVSMFSMIVQKNPPAMLLFRSFFTTLLDKTEKLIPSLTPEGLKDNRPSMKRVF